ncbi:methyltransferase domain-containing protein [Candidatus Pacearchaeota archaeon]|nr:methyltransferase domain-containing protein [Candidatus Pacearchaeota archaeon]
MWDIDKDKDVFKKILEEYLLKPKPENPRILNLGCGTCLETSVLIDFFGVGSSITGIDRDKEKINRAKNYHIYENIDFIAGDIQYLTDFIAGYFDIIIARHPNLQESRWDIVFSEAYKLHKEGGILIATSFSAVEGKQVIRHIKNAGYNILASEENKFAIPITKYLGNRIANDGYIVIAQK